MRQIGGAETWYNQDLQSQVGNTQREGISQSQKSSPWRKGSKPHIGLLSPRSLALEERLAWKASWACFQETQRAVGNRDSTLKECIQKLTHSKTQDRNSSLKGVWLRPTC